MYDIDSNIGFLGEILDDHSEEEFVMSENVRSRVEEVYKSLIEERDASTFKGKFFDSTTPVEVTSVCYIDKVVDELRQCLESEGVVTSNANLLKIMDIYLRLLGLDRKPGEVNNICGIYTIFGGIECSDISELNEEDNKKCGEFIDIINGVAEFKLEDPENVKKNLPIIFKEIPTFMNEILKSIAGLLNHIDVTPKNMRHIRTTFCGFGEDKKTQKFMVTGNWINDQKFFVYEISSTMLFHKLPDEAAIAVDTFNGALDEYIKENQEEETDQKE